MANYDFTYTGAEIQAILDTAKKLKDSGYIFLGVATPSTNPGTPTQKVYYEAKQAGTYTNFGGVVLPDGLSLLIWNGSWTSETVMCGDGGVFDISVYKSSGGTLATFADLSAALNGGNNIPVGARKGGMSVKFVQSSDNKYVQFRLMSDSFGTVESDWQNIGLVQQIGLSETVAMSQKAVTDELNKIDSKTAIIVDDDSQANLNIGDQNGNVIVQFKEGHIKTKEFDSSKVIKSISDDSVAELNIGDEEGNVIAQFKGGHIKTKEFDSSKAGYSPYIKFQGKRFAVIGDSISSYSGITKSGYATYYPKGDVISSTQTWWGILRDTLGMSCVNRAWSGSQCTGNSAASANAWAACSTQRILDIGDDGAPDIVLCYIGTNDWQGSQVDQGDWTYNDAIPADGVITEFKPAYAMMLYKIQTYYPNARIFCCTIIEDKARDKTAGWPANNSRGISLCAFNESIKYVADAFGADIIDLHNCGLTYANIASFTVDGGLHPNAAGHALMANKIIQDLISKY